jgi:hypothetical protein
MKQDQRAIERMNWLFIASFFLPFLGLGLAFAGLWARHYEPSAHWGIWCSVIGWSLFVSSYVLRWWLKRWFRRLRE